MADLAVELTNLNNNATNLLNKYDGAFEKLDGKSKEYLAKLSSEATKLIKNIQTEAINGEKQLQKIINDTDIKALGEEYKKLFEEKIKAIDTEATKLKSKVEDAIKQAKNKIKAFDYTETTKPTPKTNPNKKYATWLDLSTGVIWVCVDNTKDKNKWVSEKGSLSVGASFGKVDIFNDGSCIFFAPLTSNENELVNNIPVKFSGNITFDKSLGALNNSKNNTNAINYKNVNIPTTEFTISCFLKETKKTNTSIVTAVEFRQNFPTIYAGGGSKDRKISFGSKDGADGLGVVEVDFGKMYHVVYMVKKIDDNKTKVIGYLNGKKVIEETRNTSISTRNNERILLFQEADGTDDNGWDKGFDANQCFIGYIKHLRIFNRLLTENEIKKLGEEQ